MSLRLTFAKLATRISLGTAVVGFSLAVSAASKTFDLEARKQAQAWLWTAPRAQEIPHVSNLQWPCTPEDFFILRRLDEAGLRPARPTDDRTWLRRAYFAITGLPPTREAVQEFLSDKTPEARERVVDRLLASPRFGERWARHWMDLMRYAESRGHEGDYIIANAWRYRDYLIRAFNEDVPYDQFVLEHLAGDLLTKPRFRAGTTINESVVATGWAFLGEENHSPVDIRGDECDRIDNKVDVFSKAFLGLTVSCARCHDHKFDPIRAQDYYALSGFMLSSSYRQVRFETMENNRAMGDALAALREKFAPRLAKAIAASAEPEMGEVAEYLLGASDLLSSKDAIGPGLTEPRPSGSDTPDARRSLTVAAPLAPGPYQARKIPARLDRQRLNLWAEHLRTAATSENQLLHLFARRALGLTDSKPPLSFCLPQGGRVIADFTRPDAQPWKADGEAFGRGPAVPGDIILGDDPAKPIAGVMTYGAARRDPFWNRLKLAKDNEDDSGRLAATKRSGQMVHTPTITLSSGKLHYLIRGKTRVYASVDSHLMVEGPLHGQLVKTFDSGPGEGPRWLTHDLSAYAGHRAHIEFGPEGDADLDVLMVVEAGEPPQWTPSVPFAISEEPLEVSARKFQESLQGACEQFANGRTSQENAALVNWFLRNLALFRNSPDPATLSLGKAFVEAQHDISSRVRWESHTAVAWFDGTGVDENILLRGKPFQPGAVAPRSLPVALGSTKPITCSDRSGRYELAQQMVNPGNPLVARVIVNRIWHHVFGRGIVASVDNFGALGERPANPELLDHAAYLFVQEDHWSVKSLIRRLVLSSTFAMSSVADDPKAEERDASNALLHRMPVRRLEGEAIRDALLTVSGRLSSSAGGPPEPMFLTEFLVGRGRPEKSGPLDGDGRRSVYMQMRRNFLPTFMQTFDAPVPFSTVGKRNVTNVPGQSLALMNDPLVHEQAGVWAQRLLRETRDEDFTARIRWLFESAYGRLPANDEIAVCEASLKDIHQLQSGGENYSAQDWAELCHALLNANEFIYLQ